MLRFLSIIVLSLMLACSARAQQTSSSVCEFLPRPSQLNQLNLGPLSAVNPIGKEIEYCQPIELVRLSLRGAWTGPDPTLCLFPSSQDWTEYAKTAESTPFFIFKTTRLTTTWAGTNVRSDGHAVPALLLASAG